MTNLLVRLFVKEPGSTEDPAVRLCYGKLAGGVGIACNLLLFAGKLLAGFYAGSIAIMGDAVNNLSDAASSVVTLLGFKFSAKPADSEHPFGHARSEYVAGLTVAVLVLVIGVEIARGGVERILSPVPVDYSPLSYAVLGASILLKLWMALFNRTIGRRIGSATLKATFADSRNDVVSTSAVLVAALVAQATGLALDGWMGLGVAVFILASGVGLVKDTINPLLGAAPDPALVRAVGAKIRGYAGVLGTHDLMVHDYGPGRRFASAHVEMDSAMDAMASHAVIDRIEKDVLQEDGIHLILHHDPVDAIDSHRAFVLAQVRAVDPRLTIHDFEMVGQNGKTTYCFDVAAPADFAMNDETLRAELNRRLQTGSRPVATKITVDRSYSPIPG